MKHIFMCLLVVMTVACGKDKSDSKSGGGKFSSSISTESGTLTMPRNPQIPPTFRTGDHTYTINTQSLQGQALQTMNSMFFGQAGVQPKSQDANAIVYKARITGSKSSGGMGYSVGGYNQSFTGGNMLDVQSVQPLNP